MSIIRFEWLKSQTVWIKSFYAEGYSRTRVYEEMRRLPGRPSKTDALASLRHWEGVEKAARDAWKSTPLRYRPSIHQMLTPPWSMRKEFMVAAKIIRYNEETGEDEEYSRHVGFDTLMTREEIEKNLRELSEQYGREFVKFEEGGPR